MKFTPAASTRTRACAGPGDGVSASTRVRTSRPPCLGTAMMRMGKRLVMKRLGVNRVHRHAIDGQLFARNREHVARTRTSCSCAPDELGASFPETTGGRETRLC